MMIYGQCGIKVKKNRERFFLFLSGRLNGYLDMQDRFKIWRRDLGDTMINPYYVLRNDMLSILLEYASTILNQWSSLPSASQVYIIIGFLFLY